MPINNPDLTKTILSGPIPGQSWTDPPKNASWEQPPQFTKLPDAMNFLMNKLTDPEHAAPLMDMFQAKMPIEAIARTLLFTGFVMGQWSVDLALLMYKPLMLALIAMAHRANFKDVPVIMPHAFNQQKNRELQRFRISQQASQAEENPMQQQPTPTPNANTGFMRRT